MNILITGSKSAKTFKLLKYFEGNSIFLADYGDAPVGSVSWQFISLGERNEDVAAHNLLNKCLDNAIDLFIPLHLFEIEAVAKAVQLFNEFSIKVLLPDLKDLPAFLNAHLPADKIAVFNDEQITLNNGELISLSGVFYIGDNNEPVKLFTL